MYYVVFIVLWYSISSFINIVLINLVLIKTVRAAERPQVKIEDLQVTYEIYLL